MQKLTETEKDYVRLSLRQSIDRMLLEEQSLTDRELQNLYALCKIYAKLTATVETNIHDKQEEVWGK